MVLHYQANLVDDVTVGASLTLKNQHGTKRQLQTICVHVVCVCGVCVWCVWCVCVYVYVCVCVCVCACVCVCGVCVVCVACIALGISSEQN